jgi:hypothetical protein
LPTPLDGLVEADEGAAADEQMFVVSIWKNSWCGCFLPPAGTLATVPLQDLQKGLLDAFTRDVA